MKIDIQPVSLQSKVPQYMSEQAAGADVFAHIEQPVTLNPGETKLIPLGFKLALPDGYAAFLLPRSGLGYKQGVVLGNLVGLCDADFRGEYCAALWYRKDGPAFTVQPGERIAQMVIMPVIQVQFNIVEALGDTVRGAGGFGSSGVK